MIDSPFSRKPPIQLVTAPLPLMLAGRHYKFILLIHGFSLDDNPLVKIKFQPGTVDPSAAAPYHMPLLVHQLMYMLLPFARGLTHEVKVFLNTR